MTSQGVFAGFWADTNKKVLKRQRVRIQKWFMHHPITFGLSWGVWAGTKGLFWSLPRWGWRKWSGRAARRDILEPTAIETSGNANETVTVTETEIVDSDGNITTATTTRTTTTGKHTEFPFPGTATAAGTAGPFAMHPPAQVGATTSTDTGRPTLVVVDPIERTQIMKASRDVLSRTRLGHGFVALAGEFEHFTPVRGNEAQTTVDMLGDAYMAFRRISMSVENFTDIVTDCGLNRQITNQLLLAAESADALERMMTRANTAVGNLYEGQIEQDQSQATSVQAGLVPIGIGDEADGIGPFAAVIANCYETFAPEPDQEATLVLAYINTSQAGFAMISDALVGLASRLRNHRIDNRVRRLIRAAAGDALNTSSHFQGARQTMTRLYRGQMAQEASGVATIRNAPLRRAS
jgi:hypothetical protein